MRRTTHGSFPRRAAQVVVFGRGSQGTEVAPFAAMRGLWRAATGVGAGEVSVVVVAVLALVQLFCVGCVWGGVAGLGRRVVEPSLLLLVGMGVAGVGAVLMLGHPAESQLYFLESVRPYLSVAAVCGVVAAWRRARPVGWRAPVGWGAVGAAVALAVLAVEAVLDGVVRVPADTSGLLWVVGPYLGLAGVAVAVWLRVVKCRGVGRRGAGLVVVALLAGYGVPASASAVVGHVVPDGERRERVIPRGGREAARWVREHSGPGDVVATDLHCRAVAGPACDSRHYWVAAFSERRVLVEGWAYAESTLSRAGATGGSYLDVPFADAARLAANDAVFTAPAAENVRELGRRHGVRWLFTGNTRKLDEYAVLRFRNARFSVYEIPGR
ncbi:hypothetical protein MF672_015555 [Actinomadura sp. ATCC 31491]|uniref:Uncharacterized protein n=1 Tax=Actinomadura luzonensis TaxID=2805427 RepID=A0ABT0FS78_9ACTN|nr:hypothetical protein [Actinomadura luzonensis]MCK2215192.1 hypothetical protein [Actinomadura luzonensis]